MVFQHPEQSKHRLIPPPQKKILSEDFPGGPVIKNPATNAGHMGSIPAPGRSHHAAELLSLYATSTEPESCNY